MIPFERFEREYVDREEAVRSVGAFVYILLSSGRVKQHDVEAAANIVADLNLEQQRDLFVMPHLMYYSRGLAEKIVNGLCDHEGPHDPEEWPPVSVN